MVEVVVEIRIGDKRESAVVVKENMVLVVEEEEWRRGRRSIWRRGRRKERLKDGNVVDMLKRKEGG